MKITVTQPYSDDSLKFNRETGRYELTIQYCKDNFACNFKGDQALLKRIRKNTRTVYSFIFSRVCTANKQVVDFLLTKTEEGRKFLLDILSAQMEADVETGYNDLTLFSPVNLQKGQVLPREELKRNQVTVETEQIFNESDNYFGGLRLGYQSTYPWNVFLFVRKNS